MPEATDQEFPTILGPDANFNGELNFEKGMRLQGRFQGKISTPGRVHVAKEAKLQADVEAGGIIVEGEVKGNLNANERVELKQTARCEGDLRASKLMVEEGAVFSGHVTVGPDAVKGRAAQAGGVQRSGSVPTPGPQPAKVSAEMPEAVADRPAKVAR